MQDVTVPRSKSTGSTLVLYGSRIKIIPNSTSILQVTKAEHVTHLTGRRAGISTVSLPLRMSWIAVRWHMHGHSSTLDFSIFAILSLQPALNFSTFAIPHLSSSLEFTVFSFPSTSKQTAVKKSNNLRVWKSSELYLLEWWNWFWNLSPLITGCSQVSRQDAGMLTNLRLSKWTSIKNRSQPQHYQIKPYFIKAHPYLSAQKSHYDE